MCKERLATLDDWFAFAFDEAVDAVRYRVDVMIAAKEGSLPNLREFFRSNQNYKLMVDRLLERISGRTRRR